MPFFAKRHTDPPLDMSEQTPIDPPPQGMPPLAGKLFAMLGIDPQQLQAMGEQVQLIVADVQLRLTRIEAKLDALADARQADAIAILKLTQDRPNGRHKPPAG